jgi:peptidoglycan hydrolase CwlO-like protein
MSKLDIKRKELELGRVEQARKELEFKIEERLEEIERLQAHIKIQLEKEEQLKQEIKTLGE